MKRDTELDEIEKLVTALEQVGDALVKMYEGLSTEFIKLGDRITAALDGVDEDDEECGPNDTHECGRCGDHWVEP